MTKMLSEYIVKTPGTCGGKARLNGHRIRVMDIAIMSEEREMSPDEIASSLNISLSQVHAALAYYFDHLDEIHEEIRLSIEREEKFRAEHQAQSA